MLSCHDNFEANFDNYPSMLSYHQALSMASSWRRCKVKDLHVEPLDPTSPLYGHPAAFAAGTSEDAIEDTAANLGLALNVDGSIYPVRSTAYKTLTERAKINGTALPKLSRKDLANVLNACLSVHNSDALLLIRNEKVSAVHSRDVLSRTSLSNSQKAHKEQGRESIADSRPLAIWLACGQLTSAALRFSASV